MLQMEGSIRSYKSQISDDDIQSELPESPENKDEDSDSELYTPHPQIQHAQHTPYGTPCQTPHPSTGLNQINNNPIPMHNDSDSDMCIQHHQAPSSGQSNVSKKLSIDTATDVSVGCS
eukprot:UN04802